MKSRKFFKNNGITLVSLVVTIIVLIILAGTSINLLLGKNGIITMAKQAKENTELAKIEEETALNELYTQIETEGGTSGGISYDAIAKLVEFKEKIAQAITTAGIETSKDDSVETMVNNIEQLPDSNESVYYVTLSDGYKLPVPKGFYYVGGTKSSGAVISDNEDDKNKYANDLDGDIPKDLLGNQFVWIPVTEQNYKKVEWKLSNGDNARRALYDTSTSAAELPQIQKYEGFYIARFEAGKGTVTSSSNVEIGSNIVNSGWTYSGWSVNSYTISGKISSKADEIPYYHADYDTAVQMANNMYKTDYVQSGLVTGTMWDAMMNFIGSSNVSSTSWGNYLNTQITLASGKYRAISSDGSETASNVWTDGAGFKTNKTTRYLLTTGSSEEVKQKNLYDVAGNLWEWTQEASFHDYSSASKRNNILRGGGFDNSYSDNPACCRVDSTATDTHVNKGFRPALYIK